MAIKHTIIPHLWFDSNAETAVNYYVSLFANSRVTQLARYGAAGPGPTGSVMSISFILNGQEFAALNGGPHFKFNEAVSFLIWCDTQREIDDLSASLLDGGQQQACGWIKDRFGLIWQINYSGMRELLSSTDILAAERAMRAMMTMKKIDIEALKHAAAGH